MSGRPPPRPFELDPTRVEVVAEPEPMLPAAVEAEPVEPPPRGNRWLKWLGISGGIAIAAAVTVQSVQFTQGLMQESPFLGWPFAILLGIVGITAVGALGRELHELYRLSRRASTRHDAERIAASALHGQAERLLEPIAERYATRPAFAHGVAAYRERASDALDDRERRAGRLEGVKVRGQWRYRIDKLAAYLEAQAGTGCPEKKKPGSSSEPTGSDSAKDPGSGIDSGSIQTLDRRAALASAQAIFNRPAKP